MIKRISVFSIIMFFSVTLTFAQVEVGGTVDAGVSAGGESSAFVTNGITNEYRLLHFSIPQVNLLLFAPINNTFYFEGRLQSDTWGTGILSRPRFTLANLTYADPDKNFSISTGRFITPFGYYPSKNLTIDRTFIDMPLSYSYYLNISDTYGYWPDARYSTNYSYDGGLMTGVYFGGYATGLRWDWNIKANKLQLQSAITTTALGSSRDYTNLNNVALISRLIYNPNIEWQVAISASHGSFMNLSENINGSLRQSTAFENYRQTLVGLDFKYGMGFWEVEGEAIYSGWKVPHYENGSFTYSGNSPNEFNLSALGMNVDIKFEPPFFTGSYFAIRFDYLNFIEEDPNSTNQSYDTDDWDIDTVRLSAAFGYKLARNVEFKVLASEQTPFDLSHYAFKAMITAFF